MFKKVLSLALVAAISAGIAIGATVAWLTDEEEAVNTMVMGNVDIEQNEQQRVKVNGEFTDELEAFEQRKALMPVTYPKDREDKKDTVKIGDYDVELSDKEFNYVDKIVSVTNNGASDAYVRTLVAVPTGGDAWEPAPVAANDAWLHWNNPTGYNAHWTLNGTPTFVEIEGVGYYVWEFVHNEALAAGKTTYPMVRGFYLDQKVDNDENGYYMGNKRIEDFDPKNNRNVVNILVLSQAGQVNGFEGVGAGAALDTMFGDVTSENAAKWFGTVGKFVVNNSEELADAIKNSKTDIYLNAGTYQMPAAAKGKELTISGSKDSVIEVVPGGQGEANGQLDYSLDGSEVTFNGVTIKTNSQLYAGFARLSATYNNCVIQNTYNLGVGTSEFNNCEINITNEYLRVGGASKASFNGCTFNTDGRAILVFQDGTNVAQTVTVKDCTFNATAAANTWNGIHVAAVSIDGTNGTYVVNLEGTNTVDSDFNGLWQIKAGEANVTVNE